MLPQPGGELAIPVSITRHVQVRPLGPQGDIEPKLADIATSSQYHLCHLRMPFLANPVLVTLQLFGLMKMEWSPLLSLGVLTQGFCGIFHPRAGVVAAASAQDLFGTISRYKGFSSWRGTSLEEKGEGPVAGRRGQVPHPVSLVLLRQAFLRTHRFANGAAQHGHLGRVLTISAIIRCRRVAIELGMWRCGRSGGSSGSITSGYGKFRDSPGGTRS